MAQRPNHWAGGHFRDAHGTWDLDESDPAVDVAAAYLQSRLARIVWRLAAEESISVEAIAQQLGQSFEAQRKKLAGEQPASLRDIVSWIMICGSKAFTILPREDLDLFPPEAASLLGAWRSGSATLPTFGPRRNVDWESACVDVANDLSEASLAGRGHLLTDDWVRQRVITSLLNQGIAGSQVRLADQRAGSADVLVGLLQQSMLNCLLIDESSVSSSNGPTTSSRRLRGALRAAAARASAHGNAVVVVASGALAAAVAEDSVPVAVDGRACAIGPFEVDDLDEDRWWAQHALDVRAAWKRPTPSGGSVTVIVVDKSAAL